MYSFHRWKQLNRHCDGEAAAAVCAHLSIMTGFLALRVRRATDRCATRYLYTILAECASVLVYSVSVLSQFALERLVFPSA